MRNVILKNITDKADQAAKYLLTNDIIILYIVT